jgi:glutaminase
MQDIINHIYTSVKSETLHGKVPDYIPELSHIDRNKLGIALISIDGNSYFAGDAHELFSIQSISKVLATSLVFSHIGDDLWRRVGKEPSGSPFNSLVQLEYEQGIPRNPLINAGALVVCDLLIDLFDNPYTKMLEFTRTLANDQSITYDLNVKKSEKATGFRNVALANFIKGFGNIHNDTDKVLDLYFSICSLAMSCHQLAKSFLVFANHGTIPKNQQNILSVSQTKRLNALMQTCGFYDEAGEFTFKVGLPGKSGVGGGIVAILPRQYSVAVWSPVLNRKGNSEAGMRVLELLTTATGISIF